MYDSILYSIMWFKYNKRKSVGSAILMMYMLDNAADNDLNHPNVKTGSFVFINLVIDDFVYMDHHTIQFYDTISKIGH